MRFPWFLEVVSALYPTARMFTGTRSPPSPKFLHITSGSN